MNSLLKESESLFGLSFDNFFKSFDLLFKESFPITKCNSSLFLPKINVKKDDNNVEVTAALAGVSENDISVEFNNGNLTISGEKKTEKKTEKTNYKMMEHSYGSFKRSINIEENIDNEKITATFNNGLLKVVLPIIESSKSKKIKINS